MSRIDIGKQLSKERQQQNYNQVDVAAKLKCDRAVISRIENGRYQGSLQIFERYLNFLGFELTISAIKPTRPTLDDMVGAYDDG